MVRVRITIEASGAEVTVEEYMGDDVYDVLASTVRRAIGAMADPDRYDETIETLSDRLTRKAATPQRPPSQAW